MKEFDRPMVVISQEGYVQLRSRFDRLFDYDDSE